MMKFSMATGLAVAMTAHFPAAGQTDEALRPIRAGYAATSSDTHTRILLDAGFNSQLLSTRLAQVLELGLDDAGNVVRVGLNETKDQSMRAYVQRSAELGLDLYLGTAYRKEQAEQLEALGPINHPVVQGPRRYLGSGERPVPSPLERRYWLGQLLQEALYVAELAKDHPNIRGFNFDLEAYAENFMWRHNSSFDDQTFAAAIERMHATSGRAIQGVAKRVDPAKRYDWLTEHGLLEDYFAAQSELVTEIAEEFRRRVHAVNPDLQLGIVYYEPNWMHDGWIRGLGTADLPCTVYSELEYHDGIGPSSRGLAQRLRDLSLHARYLPGLQPEHFTPRQFAEQAVEGNRSHRGYWMFTSYSLWQPDPDKLWGPYTLLAPAEQYIAELGRVNQPGFTPTPDRGETALLTGNDFYEGDAASIQPIVTYSREPDVPFYDDPDRGKLFDGIENVSPGSCAWYAVAGEELVVDIDLTREVWIERLRLRAGHSLMDHPAIRQGKLRIQTSVNGKHFYPLMKDIVNPVNVHRGRIEADNLGLGARYLRLTMLTDETPSYGVWTVSELALWGHEQDPR